MTKGNNHNRPAKGSQIKVEPIKKLKDIKGIKKFLANKPRDLCLFTLGINTNLRACDLVSIKAGQVRGKDELLIKERKTQKLRRITLNRTCVQAIQKLLASMPYQDDDCLFQGQRGALTVPSVNRLVKQWTAAINLKGNYGSHTLRKTFGYIHRTVHSTSLPELMYVFNHATQRQTLEYLCIQPEEIKSLYLKEI